MLLDSICLKFQIKLITFYEKRGVYFEMKDLFSGNILIFLFEGNVTVKNKNIYNASLFL